MERAIRVLSIMEAGFVSGPAKNLIEFARRARVPEASLPAVELTAVSYERGSNPPENPFVTVARSNGIPVDIVHENGRFDTGVLPQLKRVVAEHRPDIIQTHNVKSHFLMRISGLWRTHHWLAFHHGYVTTDFKMRCYNQLDRWSLRAARHIVTVCGPFARELTAKGIPRPRITVRHNSVKPFPSADPEVARRVRDSLPLDGMKVLLCVGRLSLEKGHVDLVRALGQMRRRWPEDRFHLVIVGEGPEEPRILAASAQEGLADRVTLAGLQNNVQPYYAMADLLIMPSHSEGSPNALLEALIAGVPVVATCVGGIPEIVAHDETALLVNPRDPEAMATAIHHLLNNPETARRLAANAHAVAAAKYSPEAYRRALVEVYLRLLKETRPELQPVG